MKPKRMDYTGTQFRIRNLGRLQTAKLPKDEGVEKTRNNEQQFMSENNAEKTKSKEKLKSK